MTFSLFILSISKDSYAQTLNEINDKYINISVTSNLDESNKPGSLRWAINKANSIQQPVTIDLSQITEPIQLNRALPVIKTDLVIKGNQKTIIDGKNNDRIFQIRKGNVLISDLQIINGLARGKNGEKGSGGSAGMGGGLFMEGGNVKLKNVAFSNNKALGGEGDNLLAENLSDSSMDTINRKEGKFYVNRGAITGITGIGIGINELGKTNFDRLKINNDGGEYMANRGAIAGVEGIGVNGIGVIAFGGGGGFGGFGNAGNGGNGGNGGFDGGNGGNGGDGGDGGVGYFGSFGAIDNQGAIGDISFGGGGGFGGFGNAGNGGNGGNICALADTSGFDNNYSDRGEITETDVLFDNTLDGVLNKSETTKNPSNLKAKKSDTKKKSETESQAQNLTPKSVLCGNGGDGGNGGNGGFGSGGGSGGFGGNGGVIGKNGRPGNGGFGAGKAGVGFGGSGAGLGGAIFVKSGTLSLENIDFVGNMALAGKGVSPGLGKGGAIFLLAPQSGTFGDRSFVPQSQTTQLPQVVFLDKTPSFQGNIATDAKHSSTDNNNIFGSVFMLER